MRTLTGLFILYIIEVGIVGQCRLSDVVIGAQKRPSRTHHTLRRKPRSLLHRL